MSEILNKPWGDYTIYSLVNSKGSQVDISDLGAIIVNFFVKDIEGRARNIVLGYDEPQDYINGKCFFSCVVGPWANRIEQGVYTLSGQTIQLEQNEGTNHLHGASANIGAKRWQVATRGNNTLELTTSTGAGEAGYPYHIDFKVVYELNEEDELKIGYFATPKGKTPINMTQHAYFNLAESQDILEHYLQINSDVYLFVDSAAIPVAFESVDSTPMDFRIAKEIGKDINDDFSQLTNAGGFDHCWCFNSTEMKKVATLYSPSKELSLEVHTDQIGMQFYSGNFIVSEVGRHKATYGKNAGLCLETQNYPNKINMDHSEDCIFDEVNPYSHFVIYKVV